MSIRKLARLLPTAALELIVTYNCDELIFLGVAGSADKDVRIGDIVIADLVFQHDMDARPVFPQFEVPFLGVSGFKSKPENQSKLLDACNSFLQSEFQESSETTLAEFGITSPRVTIMDVASGDQFITDKREVKSLKEKLSNVGCVEMEGAGIAQVSHEYGIPFSIVRVISDNADSDTPIDFMKFIGKVASHYSINILKHYLK